MTAFLRPKISVYIATSIDGYIAKPDGGLDWLEKMTPPEGSREDYGFYAHMAEIDTMVIGRGTYEIASSVVDWPYAGKRVVVLSSSLVAVREDAELYSGDIVELTKKLYEEGARHIYIDGGVTISQFLNVGMVDEMIISIVPVVLGKGMPLFSCVGKESWFKLISAEACSNGMAQLKYRSVIAQ